MNRIAFVALALLPALLLCSCGSSKGKKKKKDPMSQTLGQRLNKPDMSRVSPYQKYMNEPANNGRNMASKWQNETFRSSSFNGAKQAKGLETFKTSEAKGVGESRYGRSVFSGSDDVSKFATKNFDAATSRDATKMAREGESLFSDGDKIFGTDNALPRNQREGKSPKIIEERGSRDGSGAAYSESDVKRLLGRP